MEKTDRAAVVAGQFRWSDIGIVGRDLRHRAARQAGNAIHGTVVARTRTTASSMPTTG